MQRVNKFEGIVKFQETIMNLLTKSNSWIQKNMFKNLKEFRDFREKTNLIVVKNFNRQF